MTRMVPGTNRVGSVAGPGAVGVEGEDLGAVVGDEEGVLELGGAAAVGGDRGPLVVPQAVLPGPDVRRHATGGLCLHDP